MKKTLSILFSLIFAATSMLTYSAYAKNEKVAICHNLGNGEYIVIVVSEKAADSHISQHGDFRYFGGQCGLPE